MRRSVGRDRARRLRCVPRSHALDELQPAGRVSGGRSSAVAYARAVLATSRSAAGRSPFPGPLYDAVASVCSWSSGSGYLVSGRLLPGNAAGRRAQAILTHFPPFEHGCQPKTKDVPSTTEEAPAPAKRYMPIKTIRAETCPRRSGPREHQTNGRTRTFYSVTFDAYKDRDGAYRYTKSFDANDLVRLVTAAQEASEYLHNLVNPDSMLPGQSRRPLSDEPGRSLTPPRPPVRHEPSSRKARKLAGRGRIPPLA